MAPTVKNSHPLTGICFIFVKNVNTKYRKGCKGRKKK